MSFTLRSEEYYRKFIELQEKLRKSEEARLNLEMKFNEMVQMSQEQEQAYYKKLNSKYKRFFEEDKKRQERNEYLLRVLERVETRLETINAKTNRVSLLRRHHRKFMQRTQMPPMEAMEPTEVRKYSHMSPLQQKLFPEVPKYSHDIPDPKDLHNHPLIKKVLKDQNNQTDIADLYMETTALEGSDKLFRKEGKTNRYDAGFNSNEANAVADDILNSIYHRYYNKHRDIPNVKTFDDDDNKIKTDTKDLYIVNEPIKNKEKIPPIQNNLNKLVEQSNANLTNENNDKSLVKKGFISENILNSDPKIPVEELPTLGSAIQNNIEQVVEGFNSQNNLTQPIIAKVTVKSNEKDFHNDQDNPSTQSFNEDASLNIQPVEMPHEPVQEEVNTISNVSNLQASEQMDKKATNKLEEIVKEPSNETNDVVQEPIQEFVDPINNVQYNETEQSNQEYNPNNQYATYDTSGNPVTDYYDQEQPQQYDENGQPLEGYNQQYDENGQPISQDYNGYDPNLQQYEAGQPVVNYDENGQPVANYNENVQPGINYDENGQPIQGYDETNQYAQQYDEAGQPIQYAQGYGNEQEYQTYYDENGQPVSQYVQQFDENGQPVDQFAQQIQYDEFGNPQYDPNQEYDESGQPYQQYDESNQPAEYNTEQNEAYESSIQPENQKSTNEEENETICENVQPAVEKSIVDTEELTENTEPSREEPIKEQELSKVEEELPKDRIDDPKPKNVADILDTDTESFKQDTKVSNDSDFDFSNS